MRVPAKINLWLEVIRKRSDGYHELASLMLPIDVCDRVELELRDGEGITLECDHPHVPKDSRNLAWLAAELLLEAAGISRGVQIRIGKRIPVGAGLGGGSSNAGAVLVGLNQLLGEPLSMGQLGTLAVRLGADVPFFLRQRPALAKGVGEVLQTVQGVPAYPLVLIKPSLMVSTRWVYQSLKLTRGESRIKVSNLMARPWKPQEVMENDLETVTLNEYPLLAQMKEWLLAQGALGALMSGSGPTVFGVFPDRSHAQSIGVLAREKWKDCWVAVSQVLTGPALGQT